MLRSSGGLLVGNGTWSYEIKIHFKFLSVFKSKSYQSDYNIRIIYGSSKQEETILINFCIHYFQLIPHPRKLPMHLTVHLQSLHIQASYHLPEFRITALTVSKFPLSLLHAPQRFLYLLFFISSILHIPQLPSRCE